MRRSVLVLSVTALLAASCAAGSDEGDASDEGAAADAEASDDPSSQDAQDADEPSSGADGSALEEEDGVAIREESEGCEEGDFYWTQPDCEPATSVDLDRIVSGGPPPDGIPPLDDPVYESVDDAAEWLEPTSPVMVVDVNDDVRAYPLAILTWHEIVNDEVGGVPLVVTYCPLCNSALVFERTIDGPEGEELLDFGTSGRLYRSNLVMYDRQHHNLWTQFEGEAVVGERFLGEQLTRVPAWLLGFEEFAELHPDAQVLSRDTGYSRDYGRNPYAGYDQEDGEPFLFDGDVDDRHAPMARLVGLADDDSSTAVMLDVLREERVVEVEVGGRTITVLWAPGQASALDTAAIDDGRDVGQTAAFVAELGGEPVELAPAEADDRFVDEGTGSTFDLRGRAVDGPLEGEQLEAVTHDDTFWFVWVAFRPDTEVVTS